MSYLVAHPGARGRADGSARRAGRRRAARRLADRVSAGPLRRAPPGVAPWLLGALGALYTIPSLALLAVLVEALGLGFTPIFVALVVYAQFMLARNVVAGINGVDPAQVDAARGLGMSPAQVLLRVELPQALPVLIGGVRVAAIASISIATLGGYVGGVGLGVLIFNGLTLQQPQMIVAGSIAACALAVASDVALRLVERRAMPS